VRWTEGADGRLVFALYFGSGKETQPTHSKARMKRHKKGEDAMAMQSTGSAHPALSYTDGVAAGMSDALLLVGRVFIASVFVLTAWGGSPNVGYLTSLGYPNPASMSLLAIAVEWIIGATLILGIGTRYGVLLALLYVIIASVTAHRYWQFPQAQQVVQYIFATKNLSILGGLLVLFVTGAGRFSIDGMMSSNR
jgi:putative oxidoreductase